MEKFFEKILEQLQFCIGIFNDEENDVPYFNEYPEENAEHQNKNENENENLDNDWIKVN